MKPDGQLKLRRVSRQPTRLIQLRETVLDMPKIVIKTIWGGISLDDFIKNLSRHEWSV
jgi:hypothetical protein